MVNKQQERVFTRSFTLHESHANFLDKRKDVDGVPQSETVRRALDMYMKKNPVKKFKSPK